MSDNPFLYSTDNKRFHTFDYEMKRLLGQKVVKIPVDAGMTCPNIDGSKGVGGCTYCLQGGAPEKDYAGSLKQQVEEGRALLSSKWPNAIPMIYFQAHSNTYAPVFRLRTLYEEALSLPDVGGISIATRADALDEECISLLKELSERTFLTVELGLQTIHSETANRINRCHSLEEFEEGYRMLERAGIKTVIHLINGLPGETEEMMMESALYVAGLRPWGVKIHMLHLMEGTKMLDEYRMNPFPLLSLEEYVRITVNELEVLPPEIVVERITGDGPRDLVIEPRWTLRKREVLAAIDKELAKRDSFQGRNMV